MLQKRFGAEIKSLLDQKSHLDNDILFITKTVIRPETEKGKESPLFAQTISEDKGEQPASPKAQPLAVGHLPASAQSILLPPLQSLAVISWRLPQPQPLPNI